MQGRFRRKRQKEECKEDLEERGRRRKEELEVERRSEEE